MARPPLRENAGPVAHHENRWRASSHFHFHDELSRRGDRKRIARGRLEGAQYDHASRECARARFARRCAQHGSRCLRSKRLATSRRFSAWMCVSSMRSRIAAISRALRHMSACATRECPWISCGPLGDGLRAPAPWESCRRSDRPAFVLPERSRRSRQRRVASDAASSARCANFARARESDRVWSRRSDDRPRDEARGDVRTLR